MAINILDRNDANIQALTASREQTHVIEQPELEVRLEGVILQVRVFEFGGFFLEDMLSLDLPRKASIAAIQVSRGIDSQELNLDQFRTGRKTPCTAQDLKCFVLATIVHEPP